MRFRWWVREMVDEYGWVRRGIHRRMAMDGSPSTNSSNLIGMDEHRDDSSIKNHHKLSHFFFFLYLSRALLFDSLSFSFISRRKRVRHSVTTRVKVIWEKRKKKFRKKLKNWIFLYKCEKCESVKIVLLAEERKRNEKKLFQYFASFFFCFFCCCYFFVEFVEFF